MNPKHSTPLGEAEPRRGVESWVRSLLIAGIILVGVGILGYVLVGRMDRIEGRLADVGDQAERAREEAQAATDAAALAVREVQTAVDRASEAEGQAREAARGRDLAESEAAAAVAGAELAREDAARAQAEMERIDRERQAELDRLESALGAIVETRRTALGLVMNLGSDSIEFDFDSAMLGSRDRELLSRIAGVLLTSPGYSVFVYGHTDDVGSDEYNQILSERRARSVRDYLVEAGIDEGIIQTAGYGKSSPRVAETTEEARAQNRRVEIGIVDVRLEYSGPGQ